MWGLNDTLTTVSKQNFMHFEQAIKFSKIFHNFLTMLYSFIRLLEYFNEICAFNYLNINTFILFLIPNSGYLQSQTVLRFIGLLHFV